MIGSIAKDVTPVASVPTGALEMVNRGRQNAIGLIVLVVLNALHSSGVAHSCGRHNEVIDFVLFVAYKLFH